jgi:hypothetical protein
MNSHRLRCLRRPKTTSTMSALALLLLLPLALLQVNAALIEKTEYTSLMIMFDEMSAIGMLDQCVFFFVL